MASFVPYCGLAPSPAELRWTIGPGLAAGFAVLGLSLAAAGRRATNAQRAALTAGWLALVFGFVSPLCNLSVALFSARVAQHMLFALVAAPLIAFGLAPRIARSRRRLPAACGAFMVALWFWHSPPAYDAALRDNAVYWAMHLTTLGAALWLWIEIFAADALPAFGVATFTGLHMCALGALLALASRALFAVHAGTTAPWGLTQLEDQQLGGALMWALGGLLFTAYALAGLRRCLRGTNGEAWEAGRGAG